MPDENTSQVVCLLTKIASVSEVLLEGILSLA
ncbi:MAG: hypothetical protein N838_03500 [Thiohalocapsa sp. PB-PSB1]|nr:MAG: hypothetical protein N838_03500 [Thiohalocapsa sp. PB-PSB1]